MIGDKVIYKGIEFEIIHIEDNCIHIISQEGIGFAILESIFNEVIG